MRELRSKTSPAIPARRKLVSEIYGGEVYEYYSLGEHIVAARGVCGGRPTIKYHRLDARYVVAFVRRGDRPEEVAKNYKIPLAAVNEAVELARVHDYEKSY